MNIELKVKENIEKNNLLKPKDTIVIGVSGGLDSVLLLHIINSLSKNHYDFNIKVAHINHQIRVGTAERDSEFVRKLCEKLNVPFYLKVENIKELAKQNKIGEEEAGRLVRYSFFQELAGQDGKILTAHHANDNAETLLMHLIRGAGLNGITGMQFKRNNIVRPLLNITRSELEEYAQEKGIKHIEDETNQLDIYSRNKVRHHLIPYIENNFNSNFVSTVTENMLTYSEDNDFINKTAQSLLKEVVSFENGILYFDKYKFNQQHVSVQKRMILISFCDYLNLDINDFNQSIVNKILDVFSNKKNCKFIFKNKFSIQGEYDKIAVFDMEKENPIVEPEKPILQYNNPISYHNCKFRISIEDSENIVNTTSTCYIPIEKIDDFVFRNPKQNDIFRIDDEKHKKLNRYLTDKKIPQRKRKDLIVLAKGNVVYWVYSVGVTRYAKRNGRFLKIEYKI